MYGYVASLSDHDAYTMTNCSNNVSSYMYMMGVRATTKVAQSTLSVTMFSEADKTVHTNSTCLHGN